jgi:acetolactate synthase I/II/III large subunit
MSHGGKILIDQLAAQGTQTVFMVPGESFLAALDGLYDSISIRSIICRHEGGAAMMAEATAKLSGQPGVVFVTRGPGTANAVSGVYVAEQDETPLVLLVGLPPTSLESLCPFQEIDLAALFSGLAKSVSIVRETDGIPAAISRAFHMAVSGRPGPVVVGLPQDILERHAACTLIAPSAPVEPAPSPHAMTSLEARIASAQSPFMIVGGPGWNTSVKAQIEDFALRFDMPVATSFRCQDYFDNRHPCYAGHLGFGLDKKLQAGVRIADLLIVAGAPLGEVTTSANTVIEGPVPRQSLVHVHPCPTEVGRLHSVSLGIVSCASAFAEALRFIEPPANKPWTALRRDLRTALEASQRPVPLNGTASTSAASTTAGRASSRGSTVDFGQAISRLSQTLPENAIITNGAGNYAQFLHRHFTYKTYRTCLGPVSGSMGYGLPAAIAAKLAHPDRTVVCIAGDGCLMMTLPELATAVQYGLNIIIIVANNGLYGTIRMHQELTYPGRVVGTSLVNPDFVRLAQSFGASGERVGHVDDFAPAVERALQAPGPALIELVLDPDMIAPGKKLSALSNK